LYQAIGIYSIQEEKRNDIKNRSAKIKKELENQEKLSIEKCYEMTSKELDAYITQITEQLDFRMAQSDKTHIPRVRMHSRIFSEMVVPKLVKYGA